MFHELPPTAGLPPRLRDLFALAGSTDLEKALAGFLGVPEAQLEAAINQMKKPRVAPAARPGVKPALGPMPAGAVAPRAIAMR